MLDLEMAFPVLDHYVLVKGRLPEQLRALFDLFGMVESYKMDVRGMRVYAHECRGDRNEMQKIFGGEKGPRMTLPPANRIREMRMEMTTALSAVNTVDPEWMAEFVAGLSPMYRDLVRQSIQYQQGLYQAMDEQARKQRPD